ncbi:MAG: hypothetical protein QXO32_01090 [Candidatus Bathyarchaeia archaeon]
MTADELFETLKLTLVVAAFLIMVLILIRLSFQRGEKGEVKSS